jgi:hypothetical protein
MYFSLIVYNIFATFEEKFYIIVGQRIKNYYNLTYKGRDKRAKKKNGRLGHRAFEAIDGG